MTFYIKLAFISGLALRIKEAAHFTKSKLSGTDNKCLQHLGLVVDAVRWSFGIPTKKLDAISSLARQLMARRSRRLVGVDSLEVFIGTVQSMRPSVSDTAF
jgi:hypothetical protein